MDEPLGEILEPSFGKRDIVGEKLFELSDVDLAILSQLLVQILLHKLYLNTDNSNFLPSNHFNTLLL